jgi:hypothetical protein
MERGVVVGGLLVSISLLLAAVFNTHASRDRVSPAAPDTSLPIVVTEYDKPSERTTVIATKEAALPRLEIPSVDASLLPHERLAPAATPID